MKSHLIKICVALISLLLIMANLSTASDIVPRKGKVYIYDNGNGKVKLHTYRAPFEAAGNTSSIIELADKLIIVDFQFAEPFAREFRGYADSLGKKIERAYLTHEHPDHWMGAIAFQDVNTYALPEVADFVKKNGEAIIKKKGKPGKVPNFTEVVKPGTEIIDGVSFEFTQYDASESHHALVIALPELKALIAQDLLYSETHLFLGNDNFDNWIKSLQKIKSQYGDYEWFIPGHGEPRSTVSLIDENIVYLQDANMAFAEAKGDAEKIKEYLFSKYPHHKCKFFIPFSVPIALSNPQQHK